MNILLLEDSPSDAFLVREALKRAMKSEIQIHHVERLADAEALLEEHRFDVVLMDLGLPDSEGANTVSRLHDLHPGLPLVVLTGLDDEAMALRALHSGADDYLVKGEVEPRVLARVLRYAIERRQMSRERRELEKHLHESQRRESLLALAGGVAHHYNNLLAVILGYTEALQLGGDLTVDQRHDLDQIKVAADRAASISQQMAIFSGSGFFTLEKVNLNQLIQDLNHTINAIVAPPHRVEYHLAGAVPMVQGTAKALFQAIENLLRNAVESMEDRPGIVRISTGATFCDAATLARTEAFGTLEPGLYVYLEIADGGMGIDAEERARMFEPFYSSKFVGRGMGLAVVLGIASLHRGGIAVESTLGQGTTMRIYLPVPDSDAPPAGAVA